MSDFWTRRKAAASAEEREEEQARIALEQDHRDAELAERSDAEVLAELDLPDPDTLEEGDDFKVFLKDAVPARIRTRALRRLWRLNPVLANVDGLVDYGEDFNDASFIIENMQTAYQVGKGMTEHVKELARKLEEAEQQHDVVAPDAELTEAETPPPTVQEMIAETSETDVAEQITTIPTFDSPDDSPVAVPSRRMRFVIDPQADAPKGATGL
ncbi:MAG: DUF3306 domain-containing protein [Pseudoruegeria sp.]